MQQIYTHHPKGPAGTDEISIELYSALKIPEDVQAQLCQHFTVKLPKPHGNRLLIIGAKVGNMIRLLQPYCSHIDAIGQKDYIPILQALYIKHQPVEFTFNRQGYIGQKHIVPKFSPKKCTVSIVQISKFHQHIKSNFHYDVVLLQDVIVHPEINILKQLMRLRHDVLITMMVPGKLVHKNLFELLSGIEKNILHIFYNQATHERMQYTRYITGRRQQINIWEIFVWIKKYADDVKAELSKVSKILQEEVQKNFVKAEHDKGLKGMDIYETEQSINQYLDFHYGPDQYFGVKNFPQQCGLKINDAAKSENIKGRALDLGCAVGRSTIELAKYFDEVVGIQYSHGFVKAGNQIINQRYGQLSGKVKLLQGDACKLDHNLGKFDVIFGGNLIDRLYDPEAFLKHIKQFSTEHSLVVLTSPYTWLEDYTKYEKWLGGKQVGGKFITTYEKIREIMTGQGFKQLKPSQDIRFVIEDNPWVYQYTNAQMTFWIRTKN